MVSPLPQRRAPSDHFMAAVLKELSSGLTFDRQSETIPFHLVLELSDTGQWRGALGFPSSHGPFCSHRISCLAAALVRCRAARRTCRKPRRVAWRLGLASGSSTHVRVRGHYSRRCRNQSHCSSLGAHFSPCVRAMHLGLQLQGAAREPQHRCHDGAGTQSPRAHSG